MAFQISDRKTDWPTEEGFLGLIIRTGFLFCVCLCAKNDTVAHMPALFVYGIMKTEFDPQHPLGLRPILLLRSSSSQEMSLSVASKTSRGGRP